MGRELIGCLASTDTAEGTRSLVISDFKLPHKGEVALNDDRWSRVIMSEVKKLEITCRPLVSKIIITGNCCQRLQSLKICKMENVIEANIERIKTLELFEIADCKFFKRLSLIPDLSKLIELRIKKCLVLEIVSGIPDLINLRRLYIKECHELGELPNLVRLSCLEEIELDNCNELQNITLPMSLIRLSVQSCRNLHRVAGNPTKLTELYINYCPDLKELASLCRVSCLKKVEIYCCQKLEKITLPTTLINVSVKSCRNLQRIAGDLTKFTAFYISDCPQLEELPSFGEVSCSEQIEIQSCDRLHTITLPRTLIRLSLGSCRYFQRAAGCLTKLTALYINDCPLLNEIPCFSRVSCLEQIRIYSCKKLEYITLPTVLISLSIRNCPDLQRVAGDLTKLTALYIRDCPQLQELPSLSQVSCLEQIAIYSCKKLEHITLPTTLISLSIRSCRDLQRIAVGGDLTNLTRLIIAHCPKLEGLPTLCRKCDFRIFVIDSCEKLQTISFGKDLHTISDGKDLQTTSVGKDLQTTSDGKDLQTTSVGKDLQTTSDGKDLQTISDGKDLQTTSDGKDLQTISDGKDLQTTPLGKGLRVSKYMRLWYCSNAVIQNSIHKLESVPMRMDMIGIAVDSAELVLKGLLICGADIGNEGVMRTCRNYFPQWSKLSSVIACFVVAGLCIPEPYISKSLSKYHYSENDNSYDYKFDSDSDSESDSYHGLNMRRGKWIITMVASDEWSYSCLKEVEDLIWSRGIITEGFCIEMKRDEEKRSLGVLRKIVDRLHYL